MIAIEDITSYKKKAEAVQKCGFYLQFHFVCAKLFLILDESFILISSDCVFLF